MGNRCNDSDLMTRTGPDGPEKIFLARIRRTVFAIRSAISNYLELSHVRVILLRILDQEMSQSEIQQKLGVDRAEVTRILKQMERDGWIKRRANPVDNRFNLVRLTEIGRERREEIIAKSREIEATLLEGLSPEDLLCAHQTLARICENAERLVQGKKEWNARLSK